MSWLTRFLGYDFTINRLESQVQDYRDLVQVREESFRCVLDLKDEEIRRLTDLMLVEHGVIHPEGVVQQTQEQPRPINRRPSWNQVKTRYEEADAKLAAESSGKLRDYWLKKDKEAALEQQGA